MLTIVSRWAAATAAEGGGEDDSRRGEDATGRKAENLPPEESEGAARGVLAGGEGGDGRKLDESMKFRRFQRTSTGCFSQKVAR